MLYRFVMISIMYLYHSVTYHFAMLYHYEMNGFVMYRSVKDHYVMNRFLTYRYVMYQCVPPPKLAKFSRSARKS
jgi:hypothetical protein